MHQNRLDSTYWLRWLWVPLGNFRSSLLQALLSARLGPAAKAHLAEKVKIKRIILRTSVILVSSRQDYGKHLPLELGNSIYRARAAFFETPLEEKLAFCEILLWASQAVHRLNVITIKLISLGCTRLSKPISQTLEYFLSCALCHTPLQIRLLWQMHVDIVVVLHNTPF